MKSERKPVMDSKTINRRKNAIQRLEKQLSTGKKTTKSGIEDLTTEDIVRIKKELETLKKRV